MTNFYIENVSAVILAGGKARRMGGQDKGLVDINGRTMISYVIKCLQSQVSEILINANRNLKVYEKYGYKVFSDHLEDYQGPLAGIASAMEIAKNSFICTCPCDGPLIPDNLVSRFYTEMLTQKSEICVAHDGNRIQPVYALIDCKLQPDLIEYLQSGERKIDHWYAQHKLTQVDFSDKKDCFLNVNTPGDLKNISEQLLK